MMVEALVVGALLAVSSVVVWALSRRAGRELDAAKRAAASAMRPGAVVSDDCVRGKLGKHAVTFRQVVRGRGRYAVSFTEVDVRCGPLPLQLELRPHGAAERRRARLALSVDVETGDRAFDDAYVVEAAPAAAARRLLGRRTRRHLLALAPCVVEQRLWGVTFLKPGGSLEPAAVTAMLANVRVVARRFARATQVLREREATAPGYRGAPSTASREADLQRREDAADRAHLADVKVRRAKDERRHLVFLLALMVFPLAGLVAVATRACRG